MGRGARGLGVFVGVLGQGWEREDRHGQRGQAAEQGVGGHGDVLGGAKVYFRSPDGG